MESERRMKRKLDLRVGLSSSSSGPSEYHREVDTTDLEAWLIEERMDDEDVDEER